MRVMIGRISGLHGVRGWVKVFSYTNPITNIINYSPWHIIHSQHGVTRTMSVCEGQAHGKGIIARLESIHDRDEAAHLLGAEIAVNREQLPPRARG
jgi:16S rRNA processing protein RimM